MSCLHVCNVYTMLQVNCNLWGNEQHGYLLLLLSLLFVNSRRSKSRNLHDPSSVGTPLLKTLLHLQDTKAAPKPPDNCFSTVPVCSRQTVIRLNVGMNDKLAKPPADGASAVQYRYLWLQNQNQN